MVAFVERAIKRIYLLSALIKFRLESMTFSSMLSVQKEKYRGGGKEMPMREIDSNWVLLKV